MRKNTSNLVLISSCILLIASCANVPIKQGQTAKAPYFAGTPLSTTLQAGIVLLEVGLVDVATIKRTWGRTWTVNPFLPWEKSFSGIQFQIYALIIKSNASTTAVLNEPEAFLSDGTRIGRAYEKMDFLDFWLDRTDEDVEGWERKKITIERTVPYFNSEISLSSDKTYIIPIILPKDSKPLAKISISMLINGESKHFELIP